MLCEGQLWKITFGEMEDATPPPAETAVPTASSGSPAPLRSSLRHREPPEQKSGRKSGAVPPVRSRAVRRPGLGRQISPQIEIPDQAASCGEAPFLVPSSCQSICENYSDLHIGGDQVLPLPASDGELRVYVDAASPGPFLHSCDVPPAVEDSPPSAPPPAGLLRPLRGGSSRWRQGSGRDRSFLFQGGEGPLSNSLLNRYLEHKLLDLYQQYMMENMTADQGPVCPLLGSELVLTSLDHITQQLSRERNLEAGLAKDMVLSYLLRVASDMQSSELSTPVLQISTETPRVQTAEDGEDAEDNPSIQETPVLSDSESN